MKPIIYALLEKLIGQEAIKTIDIISNDVRVDGDNWEILFKILIRVLVMTRQNQLKNI